MSVLENSLDDTHLVVSCTLSNQIKTISSHAPIDTGASGYAFIHKEFAHYHSVDLFPLNTPCELEVIDGRPVASGNITHLSHLGQDNNEHKEHAPFFVTKLGHYPLVLEIPWMKHHDMTIRFSSNQVSFTSEKCKRKCICSALPVTTTGIHPEPTSKLDICMIGAAPFMHFTRQNTVQQFSVTLHDINIAQ